MKLYRINALLLKYHYITMNSLDRIFDLFYWPVIDIFLWGFATYYLDSVSTINFLSMFMGGIVLWVFFWRTSMDISVYILEDFWSHNLYNMFTSPVKTSELIVSIMLLAFGRSAISFFFLSLIGYLLYSFNIFQIGFLHLSVFVVALVLMGWALGLFVTGLIFRFGSRIQVLAWSVPWLLQPFSCIFYPLSSLPLWAQHIAIVIPITHIFEGMRTVLFGGQLHVGSVLYAIFGSLGLMALASLYLGSSIRAAKKSGLLSRYD